MSIIPHPAQSRNADHLLPHDAEAEQGTLGCLLLDDAACWPELDRAGVSTRWFHDGRHAEIFEIARELRENGRRADVRAIWDRLKELGRPHENCMLASALPDAAPTAANLAYHLEPLREAWMRRSIIAQAEQAAAAARNGHSLEEVLARAEGLANVAQRERQDLPEIVSASAFLAEDLPDPAEIVSGVAHQRAKLVLSGASKAGKTWLFIDLATSVATGKRWLDLGTTQGRVLYLNTELFARTFQKRLNYVCAAKGIAKAELDQLDLWHLRGRTAPWNVIIPKILAQVKDAGYALIIVDPLYRLYGALKENSAEDMAILTGALGDLAERSGAALAIATHHAKGNQSAKDSIDRISGSGVIARDADALIDFSANEVEDAYSVALRLRDFRPMADFGVRWQFPMFRRDDEIDPAKLKQAAGRPRKVDPLKLLAAISSNTADNPISVSAWAKLAKTVRQTLAEYLPDLRKKGYIQTAGEGCKARQFITEKGLDALKKGGAQ